MEVIWGAKVRLFFKKTNIFLKIVISGTAAIRKWLITKY